MSEERNEKEIRNYSKPKMNVPINPISFPSNAHNRRETPREKKKVEKVVTGKVTRQKRGFFKEFFDSLDFRSIFDYVIYDVLIPSARDTISEAGKASIDMIFHGEKKGSRTTREGGRSHINYGSFSSINQNNRPRNKGRHDFDDIRIPSRGEAEEVLSHLADLVYDFGEASVADFYDLVGITEDYTDKYYGWRDLRDACVVPYRGEYLIKLPKPIQLS